MTNYSKEDIIKLWHDQLAVMSYKTVQESVHTPVMQSISIELPNLINDNDFYSKIQVMKLVGETPRISIVVGNYIECVSFDLNDEEYSSLINGYNTTSEIINDIMTKNLIAKASINLEKLIVT